MVLYERLEEHQSYYSSSWWHLLRRLTRNHTSQPHGGTREEVSMIHHPGTMNCGSPSVAVELYLKINGNLKPAGSTRGKIRGSCHKNLTCGYNECLYQMSCQSSNSCGDVSTTKSVRTKVVDRHTGRQTDQHCSSKLQLKQYLRKQLTIHPSKLCSPKEPRRFFKGLFTLLNAFMDWLYPVEQLSKQSAVQLKVSSQSVLFHLSPEGTGLKFWLDSLMSSVVSPRQAK